MLVAAGCGNGDGERKSSTRLDEPVKVREVMPPEQDDELTEELGSTGEELTEAGCTFGTYDEGEAIHVDRGDELEGDAFPPNSGQHYEHWAPFGIYDEPIDDGYVVHNLEHGGVAVWLGTKVDDAIVEQLDGEHVDDEEKWVIAPRRDIEGLYSAAWGKGLSCPPEALEALGPEPAADAVDEWYSVVVSTGSKAEKDVPPYAGSMKEPSPERDISLDSPF